jgi:hypothetical protein
MATHDAGQTPDGNALAGLLTELLNFDATVAQRTCADCGAEFALGEHRAYRSAGIVLRCPGCDAAAVVIGVSDDDLTIRQAGVFRVGRSSAP